MSEALYGSFKDFIFKKAVKFLRGRKALPKDVYMKLDDEARAKAFTVSGYTALEVLQEFSNALADAVEQGKTKDDFLKEMNTFLADRGYEAMNPWKSEDVYKRQHIISDRVHLLVVSVCGFCYAFRRCF